LHRDSANGGLANQVNRYREQSALRAFLSLAIALLRVPFWLVSAPGNRRRHEQAFFAQIARGYGISISQQGSPSPEAGTLFIMNHISWADIPVMMTILDADFVAKSDMIDWPIIGRLARRFNPVFVARNDQRGSHDQVNAIRTRLKAGRSVILCAEGTTSDGTTILPFRTSLFAAADAARIVQPLIIAYRTPDGDVLSPRRQREVAWIEDDDLLSGASRFAKERTLVLVVFLLPVESDGNRKTLAETVRQRMLGVYAAAPNRPR
jgi:lyso-ornithine lipid O-acyltransferase